MRNLTITSRSDRTKYSCLTKFRFNFRPSRHHHLATVDTAVAHQSAAKGWGIPNAYIKNAKALLKQYDGWWVSFETLRENYSIKRADMDQLREYQRRRRNGSILMKPRYSLTETRLLNLNQQRARSSLAFGGKSANLGEVMFAGCRASSCRTDSRFLFTTMTSSSTETA